MQSKVQIIEDLWKIAYDAFEHPKFTVGKNLGYPNATNQVEFRLLNSISYLKTQTEMSDTISAVRADIMLTETMSKITNETVEKLQLLLDKLERK